MNSRFYEHGVLESIGIEGVSGRISNVDSFALNCVGLANIPEEICEDVIEKVIERYYNRGKNFTWLVGPSSSPDSLGKLLEKHGLIKIPQVGMAGMYAELKGLEIKGNEEVMIEKIPISRLPEYANLLSNAYGFGETEEGFTIRSKLVANSGDGGELYLAFLGRYDQPVAYGVSIYYMKEKILILQGSGTLNQFRGKGIYTSLVSSRIEGARKKGLEIAVIQAIRSTSMPICQKLGFEKISDIELYAYGKSNEEHLERVMSKI
ncbi:hypothetical protein ACNF42_07630 [Cuniculiplasma sp. SKW3]|uniref:hypothetical protein n=1 Tax=Cuniculiplasma sp. SKW3 TaxID=3400170 RepID=UPI003FD1BDCC